MTTTDQKKLTITMSERRPLTIVSAEWPVIARGEWYSGQYDFQAFDGCWIQVREHADGRRIVYGYAGDWDGGGRPDRESRRGGFLVPGVDGQPDEQETVRAIRRVAGVIDGVAHVGDSVQDAANKCIANMPAEVMA